jgi:hypothetical protein
VKYSREQLRRIRNRHLGYQITLVAELLLVMLLPLAAAVPWLLAAMLCTMAVVLIVFLSRFSMLERTKPLIYAMGGLAVAMELIWHITLMWAPPLGRALTLPHVVVWSLFLLLEVVRKVKSLMREPFVTTSVVLGAASGYLTLGIAAGVVLTALWVLHPGAFVASALPVAASGEISAVAVAPALMAAAFGMLTTVGSPVIQSADVTGHVVAVLISIAGQLYVAILIGLVLSRVNSRIL